MKFKEGYVQPAIWDTFSTDYPIPADLVEHIHGAGHEHTSSGDACPTYIMPDLSIWICFHDQETWDDVYGTEDTRGPAIVLMFHEDGEMCDEHIAEATYATWAETLDQIRQLLREGYKAPMPRY